MSEIPGTTRDPVDSQMQYHDKTLVFVDTAGLRRQSKVKDSLEYYSALRTAKVVREADVCLVLVDATEPIHVQDLKVVEQAWEAGAGVILVANKWDLIEKDHMTAAKFEKDLRLRAPFLKWVPVIFTSALSGQRVRKCLDQILEVQDVRHERIPTAEVNQALEAFLRHQPPPHSRGRRVKLRYGTQVSTAPPTFVFFANLPKALPEALHSLRSQQPPRTLGVRRESGPDSLQGELTYMSPFVLLALAYGAGATPTELLAGEGCVRGSIYARREAEIWEAPIPFGCSDGKRRFR